MIEIFDERTITKKILPTEKGTLEIDADFNHFLSNFKLILKNQDLIIKDPQHFFILLHRLHVGTTISGVSFIPLGVLLLLWQEGHLIRSCPQCGSKSYIFQAGGSALSGSHSFSAFCPECENVFCSRGCSFSRIYFPIFDKLKEFPNTQTIRIRRTQHFSWSKGLVGEPTPDEVLKDGIHPIDFMSLIEKLKGL